MENHVHVNHSGWEIFALRQTKWNYQCCQTGWNIHWASFPAARYQLHWSGIDSCCSLPWISSWCLHPRGTYFRSNGAPCYHGHLHVCGAGHCLWCLLCCIPGENLWGESLWNWKSLIPHFKLFSLDSIGNDRSLFSVSMSVIFKVFDCSNFPLMQFSSNANHHVAPLLKLFCLAE